MAEIIEMPKLSDTMEEGAVASWLKEEGEFIEEGEAFVEIETDKATMEYNSPAEGTLLKILVPAGQASQLNAPICVVGEKGEDFDLDSLVKASSSAASASGHGSPKEDEAPAPSEPAAEVASSAPAGSPGGRIKASPLAKKVAKEKSIDLASVAGSGPQGRIILRDVEGLSASSQASAPVAAPAPAVAGSSDVDVPHSMMRKTIAKRLLAGKNDAPHFYLTRSVDMTKLMAWRKRLNEEAANARGQDVPKVSVNDLIIQACAKALKRHPKVNASWHQDFIRQHGSVDISVAVAVNDGLITPVVHAAHILGVRDIAIKTKDLIGRAKDGQLKPEEYAGGTFSVSNLGMMGIEQFTAIINPPQAAILAVGATVKTPWVAEDGSITVQPRMTFTMSCDHRVIDGALGAEFLQTLAAYIEDPLMMLA
ncbi:MAG: pyruvate dehydrogenase complex dihydrolipoamide acetyltransferase [Pseudobacteriovorax sp.]|nr:pyruvate dehydrogenase complex dihydrolipoamide acetyltransferase [Pseudobacteriovorax sp.]